MPVVFFTGFNSPAMDLNEVSSWSANSAWYNLYIPGSVANYGIDAVSRNSENNLLTWNTGIFAPSAGSKPITAEKTEIRIAQVGARWNSYNSQYYYNSWCGLYLGRKELDATQGCVIGYLANNASVPTDYVLGMAIFPYYGIDHKVTSYRLGYRIRNRLDATSDYNVYFFCEGKGSNPASQRLSANPALAKGADMYVEWEWDAPSKTLKLYIDDVAVVSESASYDPRICGFYLEVYNSASNNQATNTRFTRFFEVTDLYLQVVGSGPVASEPRLGSLTTVARVKLKADAGVQFSRPAGYETNNSVANYPVVSADLKTKVDVGAEGRYLSATAVGQQDLYTIDASAVKARMAVIHGVKVTSYGNNAASGLRGETAKIVMGSAEVKGVEQELPANDVTYKMRPCVAVSPVNPSTNQKWTSADLDTVKVGVKVTS